MGRFILHPNQVCSSCRGLSRFDQDCGKCYIRSKRELCVLCTQFKHNVKSRPNIDDKGRLVKMCRECYNHNMRRRKNNDRQ